MSDRTLQVVAIVVPLLGVPSFWGIIHWGKTRTVTALRGAVEDVVDQRVPGLVAVEVAPLVSQISELKTWREHVTHEISPNSGTSMKDKIDALYDVVIDLKDATKVQRKMDEVRADYIASESDIDARAGQFS